MNCRKAKERMADLLLDTGAAPAELRRHLEECAGCSEQLRELRATMQLMDEWAAPEPSPYFDGKVAARLRAEKEARPAGFLERMRARMMFGSNLHLKPLVAGTLAAALVIGGGTYADLSLHSTLQESATVRDLQSLDKNAQVFQQLDSVDQPDDDSGASASPSSSDL